MQHALAQKTILYLVAISTLASCAAQRAAHDRCDSVAASTGQACAEDQSLVQVKLRTRTKTKVVGSVGDERRSAGSEAISVNAYDGASASTVEPASISADRESSAAIPNSRYVPGAPGSAWSREEAMIVKAKLWHIFDWTKKEVEKVLKVLHGPGWENGPFVYELKGVGRMGPSAIRLAFHGCVRRLNGTGGCDGCLYWDGIGRIWMDYVHQRTLPVGVRGVPNFNNGIGPVVRIFEELYTKRRFPKHAPHLHASLRDTGKSRADLWAFAGIVAMEHAMFVNNLVCMRPDYEFQRGYDGQLHYPDSLETNSYWGKHCLMKDGKDSCQINLENKRVNFRSGRRDCIPTQLYKRKKANAQKKHVQLFEGQSASPQATDVEKQEAKRLEPGRDVAPCIKGLEIQTKGECDEAAKEAGAAAAHFQDSVTPHCTIAGTSEALCHLSVQDKYGAGQGYYVDHPLSQPTKTYELNACREDLALTSEDECAYAAKYLFLEFDGKTLNISGCYVIEEIVPPSGAVKAAVHYGEGPRPPEHMKPQSNKTWKGKRHGKWKSIRSVCRSPVEKVASYMDAQWGKEPHSQSSGVQTVEWFAEEFGVTPRESVALMGAHTLGRFHARSTLFRYIWVRNGGMTFNNDYFINLVNKPGYRFTDPDCVRVGDAFGKPALGRWVATRRAEFKNNGPISWFLERHICQVDCRQDFTRKSNSTSEFNSSMKTEDPALVEKCCTDLPSGATCKPDNKRTKDMNPVESDDDIDYGCEKFDSEGGNHELALPAEIGLYFKFEMDVNGTPIGCPGFENFHLPDCDYAYSGTNCTKGEPRCPLNDYPAGDLKLYEIVELYAEKQEVWVNDFIASWEKVLENGYNDTTLTQGPDVTTNVVCQAQVDAIDQSLRHGTCIETDKLSDPFIIISEIDQRLLQVSTANGTLEMGMFNPAVLRDPAKIKELPKNAVWHFEKRHANRLINGLIHTGVGKLFYNESSSLIFGDEGYITRNWGGWYPEVLFSKNLSREPSMSRWLKPVYFSADRLSPPFVLVSDVDRRLLQVNAANGTFEMGPFDPTVLRDPASVKDLAPNVLWYLAGTEHGDQLVNGFVHCGLGKLIFDAASAHILGDLGSLTRNWKGWYPALVFRTNETKSVTRSLTDPERNRWFIPTYFAADTLSPPFVLISEPDNRLLEVSSENGTLQVGKVRDLKVVQDPMYVVNQLPSNMHWHLVDTGYGHRLVNGLVHGAVGKLLYHPSTAFIVGDLGFLSRNWPGWVPEIAFWKELSGKVSGFRWLKPRYFAADKLSPGFVLISDVDQRLLQVNAENSTLEIGKWDPAVLQNPAMVKDLPPQSVWHLAESDDGHQLVNGLVHCGLGTLTYDASSAHILGDGGFMVRNWGGYHPDVGFSYNISAEPRFRWLKPSYFAKDKMSPPFVLISESTQRYLQVNTTTGALEMGQVRAPAVLQDPEKVRQLSPNIKWYLAEGDQLVNGLVHAALGNFTYNASSSLIIGDSGIVSRNWDGWSPEVVVVSDAFDESRTKWLKPIYFATDNLSSPFVLISEMDQRLLQVNADNSTLEMGPVRDPAILESAEHIKKLPSNAVWRIAETDYGPQLVNGLLHYVGKLIFNKSSALISGEAGYVSRNWKGWHPEVVYLEDLTNDLARHTWLKPEYVDDGKMSDPFVLLCETDQRLLQMNPETAALEVGPVRDPAILQDEKNLKSVPPKAIWHLMQTEDGAQLINGLLRYVGKMIYNRSSSVITGEQGYVFRNWEGATPEVFFTSQVPTGQSNFRWRKPMYFRKDQLSAPFALISELDHRLLQVHAQNGSLTMGPVRDAALLQDPANIKNVSSNAVWHLAKTADGDRLVNGLLQDVGKLIYNETSGFILAHDGFVARNWKGWDPDVIVWQVLSEDLARHKFFKPKYFDPDTLSPPFVIISEMDHRLLQVNASTGALEMGQPRDTSMLQDPQHVKKLPANAVWHLAEADKDHSLAQVGVTSKRNVKDRPLVNGMLQDVGLFRTPEGDIYGDQGYVKRNWKGWQPEVVFSREVTPGDAMSTWEKPTYFAAEQLSQPSVLISDTDQRLLQCNEASGELELGEKWNPSSRENPEFVSELLHSKTLWYLAKTEYGFQLVNGLYHFVGKLTYNASSARLSGDQGYLQRNWPGWSPTLVYSKQEAGGWMAPMQRWVEPGTWISHS